MGAYLSEYGCLPAVTEVAQGCGFGSSRPADRLIRELESYGVICRDDRYSRLGTLTVVAPEPAHRPFRPAVHDRAGPGRKRGVSLGGAAGSRSGSRHVARGRPPLRGDEAGQPDPLLRRRQTAPAEDRRRPHREDRRALQDYDAILAELGALCTDWDALCLCRLVWHLSAFQWICGVELLGLGYIGPSLVATMRTMAALLPTYRAEAACDAVSDPRRDELFLLLTDLLQRFRRGMARRIPFDPGDDRRRGGPPGHGTIGPALPHRSPDLRQFTESTQRLTCPLDRFAEGSLRVVHLGANRRVEHVLDRSEAGRRPRDAPPGIDIGPLSMGGETDRRQWRPRSVPPARRSAFPDHGSRRRARAHRGHL